MEPGGCAGARGLGALRLSRDPHAHLRRHTTLLAQRGQRYRHCLQRNVYLGRQGPRTNEGAVADSPSGSHRRRGARLHRAWSDKKEGTLQKLYVIDRDSVASIHRRGATHVYQINAEIIGPPSAATSSATARCRTAGDADDPADGGLRDWRSSSGYGKLQEDRARYNQALRKALPTRRAPDVHQLPAPGRKLIRCACSTANPEPAHHRGAFRGWPVSRRPMPRAPSLRCAPQCWMRSALRTPWMLEHRGAPPRFVRSHGHLRPTHIAGWAHKKARSPTARPGCNRLSDHSIGRRRRVSASPLEKTRLNCCALQSQGEIATREGPAYIAPAGCGDECSCTHAGARSSATHITPASEMEHFRLKK